MSMTAELPKKKPLLATILANESVLPKAELEHALRVWNHHRLEGRPMAFGQVVLKMKLMTPKALGPYVAMQRRLAAAPGGRKPIGLLAVEAGAVRPTLLLDVLAAQDGSGKRLGELLVDRGLIRRNQLDALLYFQRQAA